MKCKNCKYFTEIGDLCDEVLDTIEPGEIDCWGYEAATNADRIRKMTDEELAEFISRVEIGDFGALDYSKTFCDLCNGQYECDDCRLWWLKQPAEGEETT